MRKRVVLCTGIVIAIFTIGLIVGDVFHPLKFFFNNNEKTLLQVSELRSGGYEFINPLLECEFSEDRFKLTGLDFLQDKIEQFTQAEKNKGNIDEASIYFRDLNNGPWFGIDEHAVFTPASLLKLPILIAYLKKSEQNPQLLKTEIKYDKKLDVSVQIFSHADLEIGETYRVEDLIEKMVVNSDNTATALLIDYIGNEYINKVAHELGVETAGADPSTNYMTTKGYAGLYRILYNASYLSQDNSEKALRFLSSTEFEKGLVAGLPQDLKIAHKYGERTYQNKNQLHDCGIIYYTKDPYLLCVMTRGNNHGKLASFIENVSKQIYDGIQSKQK